MYTVEFNPDASVITTIDQRDFFEDVEMVITDEGVVYMRQFDESLNEYQLIYFGYQQWIDLLAAWKSPEGAFYVREKVKLGKRRA